MESKRTAVEQATLQQIISVLSDVAPEVMSESDLNPNANLRDQVDLDSMDYLNFITGISERFQIEIPEKDYASLISLNDIVKYVGRQQQSS